jgi:hypothetical protein
VSYITVTLRSTGKQVRINTNKIVYYTEKNDPSGHFTEMRLDIGGEIVVTESPEELDKMLQFM